MYIASKIVPKDTHWILPHLSLGMTTVLANIMIAPL